MPDIKLQTKLLLQEYAKTRSHHLRNTIAHLNRKLVDKVLIYWVYRTKEPREDLYQEGYRGLLRAIERFDLTNGYEFSSLAVLHIRGEIQHYLRDFSRIKIRRQWHELWEKGKYIRGQLMLNGKSAPSDDRMAAELGIDIKEWQQIVQAYIEVDALPLDEVMPGGETTWASQLTDRKNEVLETEQKILLGQLLDRIEGQYRGMIKMRYLDDMQVKEIVDITGLHSMTVHRYIKKGIEQMRSIAVGLD